MEADRVTTDCYEFLRLYRDVLGEEKRREDSSAGESPLAIYQRMLHGKEESLKLSEATGLMSQEEKNHQLTVLHLLHKWAPVGVWDAKDAFMSIRTQFEHQTARREEAVIQASDALEYAFTFMEEAFGEGQEMVVFVTELTMNAQAAAFLAENGCERYYKYNKSLLIGTRRAEILNELRRDEIYSSPLEYDF